MGIKSWMMKQALKTQLKNIPQAQQDLILKAVEENPEFFEQLAKEIKAETDKGGDQNAVMMTVMRKHQAELQKIIGGMQ